MLLLKFGKSGIDGERFFQITGDLRYLTWKSKLFSWKMGRNHKGNTFFIMLTVCYVSGFVVDMEKVVRIIHGQSTIPFQKSDSKFHSVKRTSFSLIYIEHGKERSLDLIAPNPKAFRYWYEGLNRVLKRVTYLRENATPEERFYKMKFEDADKDGSGTLDNDEVIALVAQMNIDMPRSAIARMVAENDVDNNGTLDFDEFSTFMTILRRRLDIYISILC